jgi:Kef-type K+ transport system membrane component KefB
MTDSLWSMITTPWALRADTLLGATLLMVLAALLGEVAWRVLRWPRLIGYVTVGTVLALTGVGVRIDKGEIRLAVDLALSLLLFEAGARLNLRWLGHNPWLLATSLLEATLCCVAVLVVARSLGVPPAAAAPLAIILMCVSPAVVQRVVGELGAAGQVTERLMALSALNTLYAVLVLKLLSAGLLLLDPGTWLSALPIVLFSFSGSVLLGLALGSLLALIARRLDLRNENSVVLLLGCVLVALVLAKTLQLSTLLVPLLAGIWLRNRSDRPWVWPRHFGSVGGVLVLILFVAVGSAWTLSALVAAGAVAAVLVLVRWVVKAGVVFALARPSGLAWKQAASLGASLLPLSATAWVLALDFAAQHPAPGAAMMPLLLAALAFVELPAPLVVMYALRSVGEVDKAEKA